MNIFEIARIQKTRKTGRFSSYDITGRNADAWLVPAGKSRVLADIKGPAIITHIWMTQNRHYRECLLGIRWDDAPHYSVICPLGDFFCLGHGMINSFQSFLFSASTASPYSFGGGCALNCYVPMPFKKRAVVELLNESNEDHYQYFYIDYERVSAKEIADMGYFHAEFRRSNPFGGWGHEITVNTPCANIVNKERLAWENNYVILETKGCGHYIGCNLSISNFQGTWWGEGDDMIWVDGYKWPPDLHGTGSEDYFNQAWGMQPNAFMRNGSSIFEGCTLHGKGVSLWTGREGGYQTSYIFHIENPVRFQKEIKVTIEHGHGNHLANEVSSTAYWYSLKPVKAIEPPPVQKRLPVLKKEDKWVFEKEKEYRGRRVILNEEMKEMKQKWLQTAKIIESGRLDNNYSPFLIDWQVSHLITSKKLKEVESVRLSDKLGWQKYRAETNRHSPQAYFVNIHSIYGEKDGIVYVGRKLKVKKNGQWILHLGHDGGVKVFIDGKEIIRKYERINPAPYKRSQALVTLSKGEHEIIIAFDTDEGMGWGFYCSFEGIQKKSAKGMVFPS